MPDWLPDLASIIDSLYYLIGGLAIALITLWWSGSTDRRTAMAYIALAYVLFSIPLATPQYQLPLDYIYQFDPWRGSIATEPQPPQNTLLSDVALQMIPFRTLVRDRLLRGQPPLWSHELGTGQPLLGNAQAAPFAPLHLLALPLPPLRALTVAAAWQALVSMLLTHLLLLQLGASSRASALAAIAFGLSVFQVGWLYHPLSMVSAWLPGLLLAFERLRQNKPKASAGVVICATAMLLSGHPGIAAISALVVSVWWLRCLLLSTERGAFVSSSAIAIFIVLGLSAPAVLPLTETVPLSERALLLERSPELTQPPPFEARRLTTLINPFALGSPRDGNWSTLPNFLEISSGFAGLLTLIVALAGALIFRRSILGWLLVGLIAILIAMATPLLFDLVSSLPLTSKIPLGRLRLVYVVAISVAAGLSLDRLALDRRSRHLSIILIGAACVALQFIVPDSESVWQMAWRTSTSVGLALALITLSLPRLRPWFPTVAVGAVLVDLALFALHFHPIAPSRFDLSPPESVAYLSTQNQSGSGPWRVSAVDGRMLPYLSSVYGLWDPRGFDPMRPGAALQLLRERLDEPALIGLFLQRAPLDQGFLDFLGVRYLVTGTREQPGPGWSRSYRDSRVTVWENPSAQPIFFIPKRVVPCQSDLEAMEFARLNKNFGRLSCSDVASSVPRQAGTVEIISNAPNGFRVEIESSNETILASSVTWMPGWKLRIDDLPAEILKTNGVFLGAKVGAGRSELQFSYTPWQWRIGWICCFLAAAFGLLISLRRRIG